MAVDIQPSFYARRMAVELVELEFRGRPQSILFPIPRQLPRPKTMEVECELLIRDGVHQLVDRKDLKQSGKPS
jgi:hypothetical protein